MSKTILVIDDEPAVRKSFTLALEDSGYKVISAESGEKGIEEFANQEFDLIFLDLKMPGMNGVETMHEIRKQDKKIPIYVVTAFSKEFFSELKDAWQKNIEFELLEKPISTEQIQVIVKGVLGGPVEY